MFNHKVTVFLLCFLAFSVQGDKILDFKVITAVRHGLEKALDFIDANLNRSRVDCAVGVAFVKALIKTSYKNGNHVMDKSSMQILIKSNKILSKAEKLFAENDENGSDWKFNSLIMDDIWTKFIEYKTNKLANINDEDPEVMYKIYHEKIDDALDSDRCIWEIINATNPIGNEYKQCIVSNDCWNNFYKNSNGFGYYLTHKLLHLLIAKARKCVVNRNYYEKQIRNICSSIKYDAIHFTSVKRNYLDIFLEQILLCGYEGFTDFIRNDWLYQILKSQHYTGCFTDKYQDGHKSRIKRDSIRFENGCNDHTTSLGSAVLALYYNYIVNEERPEL